MTPRQFQIEYERRLQMIDPTLIIDNKQSSDLIFSILNEALETFYKTRYSGINPKGQGFEQTEKRIDDLRTLVTTKTYSLNSTDEKNKIDVSDDFKTYDITLPDDYTLLLGDTSSIVPNGENECWEKDEQNNYIPHTSDTIESTIETIDRQKENSLSEFHLKYCKARPLRLIQGNKISLYTDGKYKVSAYEIKYLKKPSKLSINNADTEYADLPLHTHMEIVKLAVKHYLGIKSLQNYNSYSNEVNNME